jgi:hypothetical protein
MQRSIHCSVWTNVEFYFDKDHAASVYTSLVVCILLDPTPYIHMETLECNSGDDNHNFKVLNNRSLGIS